MAKQVKFVKERFFHVYNRGSRKANIFFEDWDYLRFEVLIDWCLKYNYPYSMYKNRLDYYKRLGKDASGLLEELSVSHRIKAPRVEIVAYVWMPNHYHLVLKQITDNGISEFMHRVATAYAKYVNKKYEMSGALFQGNMKATWLKTDEQLIHCVRYVHINPPAANLTTTDSLLEYTWSSLPSYIEGKKNSLLIKKYVLDYFNGDLRRLYDFTVAPFEENGIDLLEQITIDDDYGLFAEKRRVRKEQIEEMLKKAV